jgi:excisionase family DNA binding protein
VKTPTPSTDTRSTVDKLLYTPVEAAHALGVSRSTVYELIASHVLASVRIGSCRRVPVEALRSYVRKLSTKPKSGSSAQLRSAPAQTGLWS